jgi:hypothetical protein
MIATRFTRLALPTLQAASWLTQTLCPHAARTGPQREGPPSHSRPTASEFASWMTAPPQNPQVDPLARFVSLLLAGYFPL